VTTWAPISLAALLAGELPEDPPTLLRRADGIHLLYPAKIHALSGEPEAGKGWLVLHAAEQVLAAGGRVVYIDFEDSPRTIVARLLALGAKPEAIIERFAYLRPDEPLDEAGRAALNAACRPAPTLAVLDGMTEALALHGLDLRDNGDVAGWINRFPRPLARLGAAVVTVDHVVKDREGRGRYAIGAQHKLAGVDVAYTLEVIEAFGRNRSGRSKVLVAKDRHGHIREHATAGRIADLTLESHADGRVTVTLTTPEAQDAATFRPTVLMERVAAALEQTPGLSKRAVRTAVKGKNDTVDFALEVLVAEGYVSTQRDGQTVAHHPIRPFPDPDRAPVPPPCPDRAPARSEATVPPCPPLQGHGARGTVTQANGHRAPTEDLDLDRFEAIAARHSDITDENAP